MRTIIGIRVWFLISIISLTAVLCSAQCDVTADREAQIKFNSDYLVEVDGSVRSLNRMSASFFEHFRGKGNRQLTANETLTVRQVQQMRDASDIIPSGDFIHALRVWYGLNGDRIVLIYEPGFLVFTQTVNVIFRAYDFMPASNKYILNTAGELVDYDESLGYVHKYETDICIVHRDAEPCSSFQRVNNGGEDYDERDVRFVIIPVQEILKVYCDNNEGNGMDRNARISIVNVASQDPYQDGSATSYKHHLVLRFGPSSSDEHVHHDIFLGNCADFAEMCPPRCSKHTYHISNSLIENLIDICGEHVY